MAAKTVENILLYYIIHIMKFNAFCPLHGKYYTLC